MSQNSLPPNSPTNPTLKSPSCRAMYGMEFEENGPAENTLERLQREVEEELRHTDRLIISVNDVLAQNKGNYVRNCCGHSSGTGEKVCFSLPPRPETSPGTSRSPVIFSLPFCDEETPSEAPFPPQSMIRCEHRDPFPGTSQRVPRLPPLERTAIKPRVTSPPLRSYPISDRGLRETGVIKKATQGSSNYSNVGNKSLTSKGRSFDGACGKTRQSDRPLVETKGKNRPFDETRNTSRPYDGPREKGRTFDRTKDTSHSLDRTRNKNSPFDGTRETDRPYDEPREKDCTFDGTKDTDHPLDRTSTFDGTRETDHPYGEPREKDCTLDRTSTFDGTKETDRPYGGIKDKYGPSTETKDSSRSFDGKRDESRGFDGTSALSPSNENRGTTSANGRGSCESGRKILYGTEDTSVPPAHEITTASPRAFSPSKDHSSSGMNASRRDLLEIPSRPSSRGSRPSSSDFASKSNKEILSPELKQHALCSSSARPSARSLSPPYCQTSQPPSCLSEDLKSTKIEEHPHSHHGHYYNESPQDFFNREEKVAAALNHLSQLRKTPSYYRCGINQGTEFLNVCCPKDKDTLRAGSKVPRLPTAPCLPPEDIDDLIKCETKDVESVWYLTSNEKKINKKPCPKQQKAQLAIRSLVQAHKTQICGSAIYSPLELPDPDDISPEVAASMMFSQEQGIRMEECPNSTIAHLFPDEPKPQFPEKLPQGSISVVDPSQNNQEEMIEKSAAVPSEGVSDSAYTRTMREKGEDIGPQKSFDVDFAIGQSKREYVFVAQKPQRINKIQFRGNSPSWFPGYFSAFPEDEGLKVVSSPSGLFYKAWVQSNPGNIPSNDIIVLE